MFHMKKGRKGKKVKAGREKGGRKRRGREEKGGEGRKRGRRLDRWRDE